MYKRILISLLLIIISITILSQEKTTERLGNEAEFSGDESYKAKDYEKAAEQYNIAIQKFKEAETEDGASRSDKINGILDKLFKSHYFGKSYEKAIETLQIQLTEDPENDKIVRTIAQIYEKKLNNVKKAIEVLEKFDETTRSYKVENKLASYFSDLNDYENALKWYLKVYELKQKSSTIKNIAALYLKLNKKAEAIKAYEDFIETNPSESVLAKTYYNLGGLYKELENEREATEYFEKSIALKYNSDINLILIENYYNDKQYNEAKDKISLLLKNKPASAAAIYFRGLINYDTGNKLEAKKDFEKIKDDHTYGLDAKNRIKSIESE